MAGAVKRGVCRIIGGRWRGRGISFDDAEGLRPTTDRIRETVFNWLQPYIHNSHCLDLFAGSGVLGFEALSRGAEELVFVEKNPHTVKNLKENIKRLQAANAKVFQQDALSWLRNGQQSFNLVFLDPPFHTDLLEKSCVLLAESGVLTDDAIIYVEHAVETAVTIPDHWLCIKQKSAGQVTYKLFENNAAA